MKWMSLMTVVAMLTTAAVLGTAQGGAAQSLALTVDTAHVLRQGADHFVGVNLNYIRDSDANRPQARPLTDALREMGARWLRYPGGEKSDYCLWAQPPYKTPHPVSLGWYATVAGARMDFDQYMTTARAVGAEPYIVVGYETEKKTGRTEAQWVESAAAWVKYANRVKKYGVKYWEIGNENWNNGKGTPEELARIVTDFSRAMKAVDPSIQVGASGNGDGWWSKFLPTAAPALDFINLSLYNCWGWKSYDHFAALPANADTVGDAETALNAIEKYALPADRSRLRVIVSETNSKDYSESGWPGTNTLGHTLVTFDTVGQLMALPHVRAAMVWTSRWMNDAEAKGSQWYALGPDNEILPTGRAIALWGQFIQADTVAVEGASGPVSAYASRSADGRRVTVWVLNRGHAPVDGVNVVVRSPARFRRAEFYQLTGAGPDDADPHWGPVGTAAISANTVGLPSCPGISVTVISLATTASKSSKGNV